jgi:hypothetical protein
MKYIGTLIIDLNTDSVVLNFDDEMYVHQQNSVVIIALPADGCQQPKHIGN